MHYLLRAALRARIACVACAAAAQAQDAVKILLWQVKSKDNTVYLYGTIHVGKTSFYPLPDAVENAFGQSARLAVEADITDRRRPTKAWL